MRLISLTLTLLFITVGLFSASRTTADSSQQTLSPARGISVPFPNDVLPTQLGYTWVKTYDPPPYRFTSNALYRFDVDVSDFYDNGSRLAFELHNTAREFGDNIDAYEIGNEPNIIGEWKTPPSATQYARVLCNAFDIIRSQDPDALVISAGLAPTGRIQGNFDGHLNHDGLAQDEREYVAEFVAAGGHHCADAIGFHPMGFRANFNATPGVSTDNPNTDCTNGLCFRTVEKFQAVLEQRGIDKPIWATEVGWIVEPPTECYAHPSWIGRAWQVVSAEKQASNLTGAFHYAQLNYPWLENMFIFNYDFDKVPWYDRCQQMRFYSTNLAAPDDPLLNKIYLPIVKR